MRSKSNSLALITMTMAALVSGNAMGVAVIDAPLATSLSDTNTLVIPKAANTIVEGVDSALERRLRERISGMGGSDTLKGLIEKQTGYLSDVMKSGIEQAAKISTTQQQFDMNLKKAEKATEVAKTTQPAPLTCASMTTAAGAVIMSAGQNANEAKVAAANTARNNRPYRRAGGGASAADVVTEHNKYCANGDPTCDPKNTVKARLGGNDVTLADADKKVDTLLKGAGNDGVSVLTYTKDQEEAATAFLTNIQHGAVTPRRLTKDESNTPAGKVYNAKMIEYDAVVDASGGALKSILASRLVGPGSDLWSKYMAEASKGDVGESTLKMLKEIESHTGQKGVSPADMLRIEVARRSQNPKWMTSITTASSDTMLLRELVIMQALSLQMQYNKLRQDEGTSVLNSMQALETVKQRMLPELRKLETAAIAD